MKNFRLPLVALLVALLVVVVSSCKESTTIDATTTTTGSSFFVRDVQQRILTKIDPEILGLIEKDLAKKGRLKDAESLFKTYNIKTGDLNTSVSVPLGSARTASAYSVYIGYRSEENNWVYNQPLGGIIGTTGESKALMAFQIDVNPLIAGSSSILYRVHLADLGWQNWTTVGDPAGNPVLSTQAKDIEALQFDVASSFATNVFYRAHVRNIGWQPYKSNYEVAGTTGEHRRLEAFQLTMAIY